mmetsp:Transcript_26490/g.30791  ORF Transcript_26490/g.30791 Transcript_26490/m.30791 type:complete len:486 (+) Transcript_26490:165-1622(+)
MNLGSYAVVKMKFGRIFLLVVTGSLQNFGQDYTHAFTSPITNRLFLNKIGRLKSISEGPECEIEDATSSAKRFFKKGQPSVPGWKNPTDFDRLTDWVLCDESNRPIICEYDPDARWLWTKWRGTALSITYGPVLFNMAIGVAVDCYAHYVSDSTWSFLAVPPASDPFISELAGMETLWGYQMTLCTFILAFFTSQSYSFWRSVYFTTRAIQGRINDICMLVTMSAKRETNDDNEKAYTGYSEDAWELVETCTRLIRLSHTFFWASTPTCSNGLGDGGFKDGDENEYIQSNPSEELKIGPLLLSPEGLRTLEEADELTSNEVEALLASSIPPSQYTYVLLEWVSCYVMEGLQNDTLKGGNGVEENFLRQLTSLRAEYFTIGDNVSGRMPLAYVQLVQVLVDSLVWLSPWSLYSGLGTLSIPLCGLMTLFFKGLLELSKSFLDPFGNEGYPAQNIRVDVLVSELNFGTSSRWVVAANYLPRRENSRK